MNRYSNLLYKRGFLFTDIQDLSFIDEESDNIIKKWSKVNLGLYSLYYDPDLIFGLYRKEDNWIVIAGMVLNPFDGCNDSNEIAQKLYEYKSGSNIKFLNYLNQLSGRFVLISIQGAKVEIFNDACATRTVFYDRYSSKVLVSSHATLIAAIMGYEISSEALYFFYNKDYKEALIKRLPGLMSPYEEVLILSPNTKLTIPDMKIVRFFPYKVNPSYGSYDDLEEEVSDLMASQIKLLNAKTKIAMSLTAGMDSRLSLAASKDICADIDYFTFLTKNVSHIEDAKIAQQICKENDLKHNLYHWDSNKNSEGLKEFEYIWERNLGIRRGILWLNKLYIDSFPKDRIHLRSNIAEVVKCDSYDSEKCEPLSAQQLANLYTHTLMKNDDKVLRKFSEFINITDFTQNNMYNYDYRDLFEWEYKMCLWHSWLLLESDVSHDTFLLYNNREILSKMLSLPYQDRADKKIFIGMIKRLWPDLLKYPINKKIYI